MILSLLAVHTIYRRLGASSFGVITVSLVWSTTLVSRARTGLRLGRRTRGSGRAHRTGWGSEWSAPHRNFDLLVTCACRGIARVRRAARRLSAAVPVCQPESHQRIGRLADLAHGRPLGHSQSILPGCSSRGRENGRLQHHQRSEPSGTTARHLLARGRRRRTCHSRLVGNFLVRSLDIPEPGHRKARCATRKPSPGLGLRFCKPLSFICCKHGGDFGNVGRADPRRRICGQLDLAGAGGGVLPRLVRPSWGGLKHLSQRHRKPVFQPSPGLTSMFGSRS